VARRRLRAGFLGRLDYLPAVGLQEHVRAGLLESRAGEAESEGRGEALLLLEHPHVYTLGRSARGDDVRATADWLAAYGVEVHEADRGGQVTYHGPGQLVGYPIVDLAPDRRDLRRYVRDLQEVLVSALASFGIAAYPGAEAAAIGVWVDGARGREKIASIGVHLKRWITTHGFALNVATDLSMFGGIVACGLPDVTTTSIERVLGAAPSLEETSAVVAARFAEVFDRRLEPLTREQALGWLATPAVIGP
jgi:lipoyl(octanoyl) transferase